MPDIATVDATTGTAASRPMTPSEQTAWEATQANSVQLTAASQPAIIERAAAIADLSAQYASGMAILDDIVSNGPTHTNVQVRDDVVNMARVQRRILRLIKALV